MNDGRFVRFSKSLYNPIRLYYTTQKSSENLRGLDLRESNFNIYLQQPPIISSSFELNNLQFYSTVNAVFLY